MTTWLDPVRQTLDALSAPVRVFFRDDDGGWDDARLAALLDLFAAAGQPLDVAAIPAAIPPATAALLAARIEAAPARVGVHTHGFAHVNHEPVGKKCEFGPSRCAADQERDLHAAATRMRALFGPLAAPVFTPPWNRCVAATARALAALGYGALSRDAGEAPFGVPGLVELPVAVDWLRRGADGLAGVGERLAARLRTAGPVGIMLHHAAMDEEDRSALGALLRLLAGHPRVVATGMRALMDEVERGAQAAC